MPVSGRLAGFLKIAAAALIAVLVVLLGAGAYLYHLSLTLPDIDADAHALDTAQTSMVYAADGSVLAEWHGEEDRTIVDLDDMPEQLRDAVVAIEDERFYSHNGVDTRSVARALRGDPANGDTVASGSTITQQLVKILFTDGERTFTRKVREALLAYELEATTDKDVVLETYLNTVYFGNGAYGVESASERYFGVHASELDLAQSALLAAVIRSPATFSPIEQPDAALERRNTVLTEMARQGYITPAQEREARETELVVVAPTDAPERAPYFVDYVKRELIDELGAEEVFQGGLRVYTTLEPAAQQSAERAMAATLGGADDPDVALVAVDHATGAVIALVGGRDYSESQFNTAVQGHRQPGSAFKPFVLATALNEGVSPDQVFSAQPYAVQVDDGVWNVQNYENQFEVDSLTLREATEWSVNCVYARLIMQVGADDVVDTAQAMGIETPIEANPAIALGGLTTGVSPLEMASAYGTIAAGGVRRAPSGIDRVTNDRGETVYEPDHAEAQAIPGDVAADAASMLHDVIEKGTGVNARIDGVWAAGKTGTTQSYRDAWFAGWAQDVSCAVWVGYREGQVEMTDVHGIKVTGGSYPATIWRRFMSEVVGAGLEIVGAGAGEPGAAVSQTPIAVRICRDSMQRANDGCPNVVEMYLDPALVPSETCTRH